MSTPTFDGLEQALHRRGDPMSLEDFLDVLGEASGRPEALTSGEQDFLVRHTELSPEDLTEEARARTRLALAGAQAAAERRAERGSLTTREAAQLLGRAEANVRRSRINGDLYAVRVGATNRTLRFPSWQFTDDGDVVPGLRHILTALPADFHPLDVEAFMTTPHETLESQAPAQWLASGGAVQAVADLAEELSRQ